MKKYKKNKMLSNVNIILTSFVLAVGVNVFLINGTDMGSRLKTSVLNSQVQETKVKSNLYIENIENDLYIVSDKKIDSAKNISLSLTYNPENIEITSTDSNIGDVTNISNTPGINSIFITGDNMSVKKGDKILKIVANKKENKSENLNIINANFKDNEDNHFELSTSGITF